MNIVDLSDLNGDLPLDVNTTTQVLWKTEDWENPRWQNPGWPNTNGGDTVGFPSIVKNDQGPNADGKYYLFYSHHDPMSGIGVAVADSITGPFIKNNVPGRSDNLVVPSFQYDNANWSPDSPDHYSSPSVAWNEDHQQWHMYFHYFNHIRPDGPDFQLTALATASDLTSHNWTPQTRASSPTTPNLVPVLPTASYCSIGCGSWNNEASSYNVVSRLPAPLPGMAADQTWLAFIRGTPTSTSLPALGFATSSDGINWNHFSENPVIHQPSVGPGGFGERPGVYRPAFIGYLGPNASGVHEYLAVWAESHFFDGGVQYIYARTTDFKSFTRDPRGFANWPGEDGPVSVHREGNSLYLFSKKSLHTMQLSVVDPTAFEWNAPGSGSWLTSTNWSPTGVPNGNHVEVTFGGAATSPANIVINSTVQAKTLRFDHSQPYQLTSGQITVDADSGDGLIDVVQGSHRIDLDLHLGAATEVRVASGAELVLGDELRLNNQFMTKTGNGILRFNGTAGSIGGTLRGDAGVIQGDGTLGGRLLNLGSTVAPGNSTGVLTVAEDFTQTSGGRLQMEIGGTVPGDDSHVLVADGFQAGGTLEVLLTENFSPAAGDSFDLFDFTSASGNFSSIQLPTGIDWDISNLLADGTLVVVPTIFEWNGISNGQWTSSASWTPAGVPDGDSVTVRFGAIATSTQVVDLDQSVTVKEMQFDNANIHILVGGNLNMAADTGSALIDVAQGDHHLLSPVSLAANTDVQVAANASLSLGGNLNLNGQVLTKTGSGTLAINTLPGTIAGTLNALEGTVTGDGVLLGDLHNASATVDPGGQLRRLVVAGNYSQDATGVLRFDLDSPQDHDKLLANSADFAGALQLTLAGGYVPVVGEVFDVLDVVGISTGNFDTWDFPPVVNWDVSNLLEDGTISVVPSTFTWIKNGAGNWSDSANWSGADVPAGVAPVVLFANAPTEPTVIVADVEITAQTLIFSSTDQPYFIVGGNVHLQAASGTAGILSFGVGHHITSAVTLHSDTGVNVGAGSALTLSGGLDLNGFTLTTEGDGTLFLDIPFASTVAGTIQVNSGMVAGTATVVGDIRNFSVVAPGIDGVGSLVLHGDYVQSAGGQLQMELSDQGSDQLAGIAGTLNGIFELSVLEGFIPEPNTTFQLLSFGTVSGQFHTLNLQTLPGGLSWVTTDLATLGQVSVIGMLGDFDFDNILELSDINELVTAIAAGSTDAFYDLTGDSLINGDDLNSWIVDLYGSLPGDANLDRAVDGQDFSLWENHRFTASDQWGHGDFDANGIIDVRDFNIWNQHKSQTTGISELSLPEPSSCCLAWLAAGIIWSKRRTLRTTF